MTFAVFRGTRVSSWPGPSAGTARYGGKQPRRTGGGRLPPGITGAARHPITSRASKQLDRTGRLRGLCQCDGAVAFKSRRARLFHVGSDADGKPP